MRVRAVECAKGYSPSLHHSDADIRQKLDATCVAKRDTALAQWIGMWRVGAVARLPALVQPGTGHVPSVNVPADIQRLYFADRAAVMLVQLAQGTAQVIDLMTGRVIWSSEQKGTHFFGPLSPNGRMFAFSDGEKVLLRLTETGDTLAELPKGYAYNVQWLGSHGLMLDREGLPGGPLVLDFRRREQFDGTTRWRAVPAPGHEAEFVLIGYDRIARARFADAPAPPGLVTIEDKPAVYQDLARYGAPTADGRRFIEHIRGEAVVVTDLSTLEGRRVNTAPLYVEQALPAPAADQVVVQGYIGNVNRRTTYLVSLSDLTLAEVDVGLRGGRGGLQFAGALGKMASFYGRELRFHEVSSTEAPRRLDTLAAEELASANQQKLDALAKALAAGSSPEDSSALAPKMQSGRNAGWHHSGTGNPRSARARRRGGSGGRLSRHARAPPFGHRSSDRCSRPAQQPAARPCPVCVRNRALESRARARGAARCRADEWIQQPVRERRGRRTRGHHWSDICLSAP